MTISDNKASATTQFDTTQWRYANNQYWRIVIAILGFALSLRMFYPGLMSNDSIDQYSQALRFTFSDWHPPIIALIWSLTNDWIPGPLGMLLLYSSLYWGALLLLSQSIAGASERLAMVLILCGFAPFAIGNLGTIWKDVFHAVATLFAIGLLSVTMQDRYRQRHGLKLIAVAVLLLAAMARFNALAALPPLIWLLVGRPPLRRWKAIVALTIMVPVIVVFTASGVNNRLLRVEKTGVYSSLLIYDLGAITQATGSNAFGQAFSAEQERKLITTCYTSAAWDTYSWGECAFVAPSIKASGRWASRALLQSWLNAIVAHPYAYVHHRLGHWWRFLWHPQMPLLLHMQANPWGFEFHKSSAFQLLERCTEDLQNGFLYKPGFWLLLAVMVAAAAARWGSGTSRDMVIALNLSAALYLVSYLPIGVATDFRYAYWSILATWFSLPLLWLALGTQRPVTRQD